MAIIPETQYPGKTTPASAQYPYGGAQNVTVSGDGTGTPWEAALLNDIFGFQQALLTKASIVPSGSPEDAQTSQYLQALLKLAKGVYTSIANLDADDKLVAGDLVYTTGYYAENDGGGNFYRIVSGATGTPDGGSIIELPTSGLRAQAIFTDSYRSVKQWGAVGDGVADDRAAIQAALDFMSAGDTLHIPASSAPYLINATDLTEALEVAVSKTGLTVVLDGDLRGTTFVNQVNPPYTMRVFADKVTIRGTGSFSGDGTVAQSTVTNDTDPGFLRIDGNDCRVQTLTFERYPQIGVYLIGDGNKVYGCTFKGAAPDVIAGVQYFAIRAEDVTDRTQVIGNYFTSYDAVSHGVSSVVLLGGIHTNAFILKNISDSQLDQVAYANLENGVVAQNIGTAGPFNVRGQGLKLNAGSDILVASNIMRTKETGIQLINTPRTTCEGNTVDGFDFGYGINAYDNTGGGSAMDDLKIVNNVVVGDVSGSPANLLGGINFNPNVDSDNVEISHNTLRDCGFDRIDQGVLNVQPNSGVVVTNLTAVNNKISGSVNRFGIYVLRAEGKFDLSENDIVYGASGPSTAPLRGINLVNSSEGEVRKNHINNKISGSHAMDFGILSGGSSNIRYLNNTVLGWDGVAALPWPFSLGNNEIGEGNRIDTGAPLKGTVTLSAAATTAIANANVASSNRLNGSFMVRLTPLNTPAASLVGSSKSPYVTAITQGVDFTLSTADGTAAAGTEIFNYEIVQ